MVFRFNGILCCCRVLLGSERVSHGFQGDYIAEVYLEFAVAQTFSGDMLWWLRLKQAKLQSFEIWAPDV